MMVEAQRSESIRGGPQHNTRHAPFLAQSSVVYVCRF